MLAITEERKSEDGTNGKKKSPYFKNDSKFKMIFYFS
jgi:hypothetical protein